MLGFELQAVQAVASPVAMQMPVSTHMGMGSGTAASHADAVVHAGDADSMVRADDGGTVAHAANGDAPALVVDDDSAAQPDCPKHSMPHDCCHASACQSHCVYTPGVIDVPA